MLIKCNWDQEKNYLKVYLKKTFKTWIKKVFFLYINTTVFFKLNTFWSYCSVLKTCENFYFICGMIKSVFPLHNVSYLMTV